MAIVQRKERKTYGKGICPQCGKVFEKKKPWQVYDADTCRIKAFHTGKNLAHKSINK